MLSYLTIFYPGLEESVQETINATNYAGMLTSAHFLRAAVERINCNEHNALDVLFAFIHSLEPNLRDWPYEAEDDWLLSDQLTMVADNIRRIITPMLPHHSMPHYHSHSEDSITMLISTYQGYHYAF
ncbi:hypothetical protein pEaSNUABM37_00027 [Erwinia phage pEa_SNUABM_37]|nr:hypothetical protein pEaSNUABM37_00027 [Erwinia phage pEa_SNUABM_37]QXO10497.1 hypothetical protein pEaSNUABM48_00027 [Erwinia phage pEa_SNUABM_48]